MVRSRVFVFLAIALFLAGWSSAETTSPPSAEVATEATATEKVTELQAFTARVFEKAKKEFNDAESLKLDVESQKRKADNAESAVRTAAAAITATERKTQADAVAVKATQELGNCVQLYDAAKEKADQASNSLNAFVESANTLVQSAKINIPGASTPPANYEQVIQSAAAVTGQTTTLSREINASTVLADSDDALTQLRDSAKKIEVFKYQAESIAIVFQMETALKSAETDIQNIPHKKKEVDATVQAIKTKCESAPDTLKRSLSQLCTTADTQLQTATTKLQEAQQCNTVMQERKTQLDTTLETLKDTTDEDTAKAEAANVKGHEGFIDGKLQKIKQALLTADNALSSAKGVEQQMQDELSKTSAQPVDAHLDTTEQTKSTQLTDNQTPNPKDDKSELLNKDKVRNITKDITNNPLIGGEVRTRSAANDSAVTVFIPLLVILVISAVLH